MPGGLKTRHTLDKSGWGDGPWMNEPDEAVWFRPPYSLRVWRHSEWGMLNGYVGVLPGHPLYGVSHQDERLEDIEVHGDLTFSGIETNQDTDIWWFGFDTHHAWDWAPGFQARMVQLGEHMRIQGREWPEMPAPYARDMHYRDFDYVVAETESLCLQLDAIATGGGERDAVH